MAKKLIISIDGGGIRGVIPLVILRELQLLLKRNLDEYDPEWWGTSTGAVIAAGLNVQKDRLFIHRIQTVLDIYEFRSEAAANPFGAENPARAFNKLIEYNFSPYHLIDFPQLNIVACRTDTVTPYIFNHKNPVDLAEAVKASCAIPAVFPIVKIGDHEFVDGFIVAKNPTALSLHEKELNEDLIVLSLGCGVLRVVDDIEKQVQHTHQQMLKLAETTGMKYYRFDPVLEHAQDAMQNANPTNIFNLKKDAMEYLFENHDQLKEFASVLDDC
ncbi:patatin-like phospholipase family protein [Crocinitomix catalasitica]|nr:patatin-like phospholipase family protein [Crocinitomix catalasitica]